MTAPLAIAEYKRASQMEARLRREANVAAADRATAIAEAHQCGMSYGRIAQAVGLSRSRVQQLVERANRT